MCQTSQSKLVAKQQRNTLCDDSFMCLLYGRQRQNQTSGFYAYVCVDGVWNDMILEDDSVFNGFWQATI